MRANHVTARGQAFINGLAVAAASPNDTHRPHLTVDRNPRRGDVDTIARDCSYDLHHRHDTRRASAMPDNTMRKRVLCKGWGQTCSDGVAAFNGTIYNAVSAHRDRRLDVKSNT